MAPKKDWNTALLPSIITFPHHLHAALCPCVWTYYTAKTLLKDHAAVNAMDDSGCGLCYSGALSVMICSPGMFCVERSVSRLVGTINPEEGPFDYLIHGMGSPWTTGYDLSKSTEDYWAADWCGYYMYHAFCCNFMRCRACDGTSVKTPMCFALLCGATYPFFVCPATLMLRRVVVSSHRIHESCFESICCSLFCAPCTMVQTFNELPE